MTRWMVLDASLPPGQMHTRPIVGTAIVTPTEIPGLVDIRTPDGTELRDLTMGQTKTLAWREGWIIETQSA